MSKGAEADRSKIDARYALYDHAHHDLWWARSQQWNITNWAILLMAATAGIASATSRSSGLTAADIRLHAILVAALGLIAGICLLGLHGDVLHSRKVYRVLERNLKVDLVRAEIPQAASEETDCTRGLWHLRLMISAI